MTIPPKTKGSRWTVPLTAATTAMLRDHLARHPRRSNPTAPLFPNVRLAARRPTGIRNPGGVFATNQATALADLAPAEARERLARDWDAPLRHATFCKAVYRPAVLRADRPIPAAGLPPALKLHALPHT